MRIAVAGTHGSGKSTLIADFLTDHPGFVGLPEPFEFLDELDAAPNASGFLRQLSMSEHLLSEQPRDRDLIAERSPLDFVAYLLALAELGRPHLSPESMGAALATAERALDLIDLLVVLPLEEHRDLHVGSDEDLPLRAEMNQQLLELVDAQTTGRHVIEITGSREERRRALAREYRAHVEVT